MSDRPSFKLALKKTAYALAAAAFVGSLAWCIHTPSVNAVGVSIGGPSDCDSNAIIRCGAHSTHALVQAYRSSPYVRKVYRSFGISPADMTNLHITNVVGRVTRGGNVYIDGSSRLVAKNAVTGGRQNIAGSTRVVVAGAVFYRRPPSVSFQSDSLPAFISMVNGRFQFAVIASCGNAVSAIPVTHPRPPAPVKPITHRKPPAQTPAAPASPPAPAQTQIQQNNQQVSQNQSVVVKQAPAPAPVPTPAPSSPAPAEQPPVQKSAEQLPNTGPGSAAGLFTAVSLAGFLGYRQLLLRRLNRQK